MRIVLTALTLSGILSLSGVARAQSVELSLGSGRQFNDGVDNNRVPTNVMVALGYGGLPIIEPQIGIVGDLGDVENQDFDLQFRPQVKLSLPVIPVYGRVILSVVNIFGDGDPELYYGGGLGIEIPAPLVSPFVEVAYLPTSIEGATVFEARLGVGF